MAPAVVGNNEDTKRVKELEAELEKQKTFYEDALE